MKCKYCGAEFEPAHGAQRYCTTICRDKHSGRNTHKQGTTGICQQCGNVFIKAIGNEKYCSAECRTAANKESKRISDRERWHRTHIIEKRICTVCGAEFVPKRPTQETCSHKCYDKQRTIKQYCNGLTGEEREAYKRESKRKNLEKAMQARKANAKPPKERTWYTGTCKVCGKEFRTLNPAQVTCSKECGKRYSNARKQHRIPKAQLIDKDITLEALYRRDAGVCYLCGKLCDWDDRHGNIVGANYPSIDHVIPIARGGLHSWGNVRLAHHGCNSAKGIDLIENADDLIPANAYEFKRNVQPIRKATEQYTTGGELVAVYPSTADAERVTGIGQKGIQNCARGESRTYKGYVWKYTGV